MISVCLASYNGQSFISQQISSILPQLNLEDELLISDDGSKDLTVEIINSIQDPRIKLYHNTFANPSKNFEFLIEKAKGDLIFLSDQDDIWFPDKLEKHKKCYNGFFTKPRLVISDYSEIDGFGNELNSTRRVKFSRSIFKSLYINHFTGCTMSFNASLKTIILPFSKSIPMHDWWIGILSLYFGDVVYIKEPLIYYRRHPNSVTTNIKTTLIRKITWRINIFSLFFLRVFKILFKKLLN